MADRMSESMFRVLSRFPKYISGLAIAFGVIVLTGWALHIQRLKGLIPGQVTVKANAAVCFVLIGLALWLAVSGTRKRVTGLTSGGLALLASFIGLLSFLEYWKGWELGIDQLLFTAGPDDLPGSVRLGLMSPVAAADFFLLGTAIVVLDRKGRWWRVLESLLSAIAAVAAMFGLLDFVIDPQNSRTHIAPLTALILFLFSFAVLLARTEGGLGALVLSRTVGGVLCRRLLPSAILIPPAIAWLRWRGHQVGLYSDWTGLAMMTVISVVLLAGLTVWTAFVLDRSDADRSEAERKIREASRYTRSLIEASLDPLVTINREGKITDVNQATERATGIAGRQLIGSDFSDYFTEPEKARAGYQQVFESGFVRDYALAIRNVSGTVMDVLYNATVLRGPDGEVEGVFAAARDITERKRAEENVRESALYARNLIEASLDPLVTISKEGKITDVNRATEGVTGVPRQQLIGSDFSNYFTEPDNARQGYEQVFTKGEVRDYALAIRHNSGQVTDVVYNATVFKNEAGEVEGVFAAARDITERKRAEQAVRTERQRFREVLDKLPVYVVLLTPDYHVALDNTVFRERFGEHRGRRCYEYLFNRNSPCEICETYGVLKTGAPHEWKWAGPDGRDYDIFDFPFTDSDGSPLILEMGLDVTEWKRAEAEVHRLNEELEQRVIQRTAQLEAANKELEAFTYSVSHDLRAPLRHISGFSKMLSDEFSANLPADAQHYVQRIQEGTRRMGQLVDDLLNLGRVGRKELSLQVSGLRSIVDEVIEGLKSDIGDRQVEWEIGGLPFVECDPALMKQVFQNLLSNAVKFTRPRPQAVIEVGQKEQDGHSVVFVCDNGVGFSMKYADKLFGVFQRLHRAEDFEGTGVGLATVQRIIQKHGGRIWAEAELDKGATFYFTLGNSEKTELQAKAAVVGEEA